MDDPIFGPWGRGVDDQGSEESTAPVPHPSSRAGGEPPDEESPESSSATSSPQTPVASPAAPRWRSLATSGPSVPRRVDPGAAPRSETTQERPALPKPLEHGAAQPLPRARLAGAAGFLRTMAVPRLEEIARRLEISRHRAAVEDRLAETRPLVRLTVRPWRGPWTDDLSPPSGALEIALEDGESVIVVRISLDSESAEPTEQARISPSSIRASWIETVALDFVRGLLAQG